MKQKFVFSYLPSVCAGLLLIAGALASCTYAPPVLDGTSSSSTSSSGGSGGSMCGVGLTDCDGTCVDTRSDVAHCGECNIACATDFACKDGLCKANMPVCTPGTTEPCYDGPEGTQDVGPCQGGMHTCLSDGLGYGPCVGQVLPVDEICGNEVDEDCNGLAGMIGASCLTLRGLVVRYVLDEGPSDPDPTMALDSARNPLDLPIDYGGGNMSYIDEPTGRGFHWNMETAAGTASTEIDGTKVVAALEGKTRGTIEVVAAIDAVDPTHSRIFTIGMTSESGRFTLSSRDIQRVQFRWLNEVIAGDWPYDWTTAGRGVLHVVVDTTQAVDVDRVRLYANGVLVAGNTGTLPAQGTKIDIGAGRTLYLGNRDGGMRSFAGSLYYAALYDRPLTEAEITKHVSYLVDNDDQ